MCLFKQVCLFSETVPADILCTDANLLWASVIVYSFLAGILIDQETNVPIDPHPDVMADYDNIKAECAQQLSKWVDPAAPLHEAYPITIREYDGKQWVLECMNTTVKMCVITMLESTK